MRRKPANPPAIACTYFFCMATGRCLAWDAGRPGVSSAGSAGPQHCVETRRRRGGGRLISTARHWYIAPWPKAALHRDFLHASAAVLSSPWTSQRVGRARSPTGSSWPRRLFCARARRRRRPAAAALRSGQAAGVAAWIEASIGAALSIDRRDIFLVCLEFLVPKLCFVRRVAAKNSGKTRTLENGSGPQLAAFLAPRREVVTLEYKRRSQATGPNPDLPARTGHGASDLCTHTSLRVGRVRAK